MNRQLPPEGEKPTGGDQGFRQIGSLMPRVRPMPAPEDLIPERQQPPSATTGTPAASNLPTSSIGAPHGGHGAVVPTTSPELQAIIAPASERASRQAVAALLQRLNESSSAVAWIERTVYGKDGQADFEIVGVKGLTANRAALLAMDDALAPICAPARDDPQAERRIVVEVSKLLAVTAGRKREGGDDDLAMETIIDDLSAYPADCVLRALGAMRRGSHWRPTLAALIIDTEWRAAPRLKARESVRKALEAANVET